MPTSPKSSKIMTSAYSVRLWPHSHWHLNMDLSIYTPIWHRVLLSGKKFWVSKSYRKSSTVTPLEAFRKYKMVIKFLDSTGYGYFQVGIQTNITTFGDKTSQAKIVGIPTTVWFLQPRVPSMSSKPIPNFS